MRMNKVFTFIFLFTATCVMAQVKQTVTKSDITFSVKNLGIATGGSIGGLQAEIIFDKDKPETGSIQGSVDVNAINTDNDSRDTHLKSADYFDVAKYPRISMKSVSIKHKSGNSYVARFSLTIKDKTRQLDIPFIYTENGTTAQYKGSFKINRTDFGIGNKGLVLGNEVTIFIDIQTTQQAS